ncbi:MAG: cell division protein FtsA [Armatimonadota bacterium]|nr:cell division protein FtsA [Armatimonadota bacterium]MDR5696684.1 cell division protein FtsA [Armatimonadota bacterium]
MTKRNALVGLDIGTTKVCAIVAEADSDGEVHIAGVGTVPSLGLRRGVVTDLDATTRAIEEAVERAERMSGYQARSAYVAVSGEHIASQNSRGVVAVSRSDREIAPADVERVIEAARIAAIPASDREIIHMLPRDFVVDGQGGVRNPVGMYGTRLEVEAHIVTGASTLLANLVKCVHRAGLEVEEMVLEPLASAEAVLSAAERDLGVVLCDIGGGTTSIGVFSGGGLVHTVVLPLGGNHITHDIAFGLRTAVGEAEKLKVRYGAAASYMAAEGELIEVLMVGGQEPKVLPRRHLCEIVQPRVEEILAMVQLHVGRPEFARRIPAGVVLTGGTALLRGIAEVAGERLGLPARVGYPVNIAGLTDTVNSPAFATAVGLVVHAASGSGHSRRVRERNGSMDGVWARLRSWVRSALQGE